VDEVLQDNPHRRVVRAGDTVRRPLHPWSPTIHALLQHLESVGFPFSPRFLGIDDEGREVLTYIDGDSGPGGWAPVVDEDGLAAMAVVLRDYHEAVADFRPDAAWAGLTGPPAPGEIVCHGDVGPWNLVWRAGRPVGILDWDYAWPRPPLHDVAYALEYVAPFRDDATCLRWLRYPTPPARRRRLQLFARAYAVRPDGLVDEVIAQQEAVLNRTRLLAATGHQPQADWLAAGTVNDDNLRWSRTHRHLFEEA
jgi:hypothetical protein